MAKIEPSVFRLIIKRLYYQFSFYFISALRYYVLYTLHKKDEMVKSNTGLKTFRFGLFSRFPFRYNVNNEVILANSEAIYLQELELAKIIADEYSLLRQQDSPFIGVGFKGALTW